MTTEQERKYELYKKQQQILLLKEKLHETDYQALKYAEGEMSISEYLPIREQRKAWRREINQLEDEIGVV